MRSSITAYLLGLACILSSLIPTNSKPCLDHHPSSSLSLSLSIIPTSPPPRTWPGKTKRLPAQTWIIIDLLSFKTSSLPLSTSHPLLNQPPFDPQRKYYRVSLVPSPPSFFFLFSLSCYIYLSDDLSLSQVLFFFFFLSVCVCATHPPFPYRSTIDSSFLSNQPSILPNLFAHSDPYPDRRACPSWLLG